MSGENDSNTFPKERGNFNSSCRGYTVEARSSGDPISVAGRLFGPEWRTVNPDKTIGHGVPVSDELTGRYLSDGLMNYAAAQTIRWWLHAIADYEGGFFRLQTRIVEHNVELKCVTTSVAAHEEITSPHAPKTP